MGKVTEKLNRAIQSFLNKVPEMEAHVEDKDNPHGVTKEQVGLSKVSNEKQASEIEFNIHRNAAVLPHPDGSVTTNKIATGAVTSGKLASEAVTPPKILEGAIRANHIYSKAVSGEKIADKAVTEIKLADGAVTANKIADGAVTADKLDNGAVDSSITDGTITDDKIGSREITSVDSGTFTGKLTALFNHISNGVKALAVRIGNHTSGTAERHTADTIDYDSNLTVKGKIDNLILTEMGGIPDHTHTGQSPDVSRISYEDLIDKPKQGDYVIRVAANNATQEEKDAAHYVCDGVDDGVEFFSAIDELWETGGTIQLSNGNFDIGIGGSIYNEEGGIITIKGASKTVVGGAGLHIEAVSEICLESFELAGSVDGDSITIEKMQIDDLMVHGRAYVSNSNIGALYVDTNGGLIIFGTSAQSLTASANVIPKTAELISQLNEIDINDITIIE